MAIERLLGDARLYDSVLRAIVSPELTIEIHSGFVVVTIRNAANPMRYRRRVYSGVVAVTMWRDLVTSIRGVAGIIVVEETRLRVQQPCHDCNSQGGAEDGDGNWIGCKACDETGLV